MSAANSLQKFQDEIEQVLAKEKERRVTEKPSDLKVRTERKVEAISQTTTTKDGDGNKPNKARVVKVLPEDKEAAAISRPPPPTTRDDSAWNTDIELEIQVSCYQFVRQITSL
jgi:hypothetical protein